MANLLKRVSKVVDPKTGKTINKKSRKWYVEYRDANGRTRRKVGFTDKAATQELALKLERRARLEANGLHDRFDEHLISPIADHLNDFEKHLQAKNNTL